MLYLWWPFQRPYLMQLRCHMQHQRFSLPFVQTRNLHQETRQIRKILLLCLKWYIQLPSELMLVRKTLVFPLWFQVSQCSTMYRCLIICSSSTLLLFLKNGINYSSTQPPLISSPIYLMLYVLVSTWELFPLPPLHIPCVTIFLFTLSSHMLDTCITNLCSPSPWCLFYIYAASPFSFTPVPSPMQPSPITCFDYIYAALSRLCMSPSIYISQSSRVVTFSVCSLSRITPLAILLLWPLSFSTSWTSFWT